ncbi:hypothetical protein GCM10011576_27960 [Micromonospora parathelypteridis]|nr:hypothetical protein GCM10011576_27960 [Micromonospora parathelypteridis]
MPAMMQSAYARIGTGPSCQTAVLGLGRAAWGDSEARVTGAHATAAHPHSGTPGGWRVYLDDFWFAPP